jgi:hypothetical protein
MRFLGSRPSRVAVIQTARAENGEAGLQGASRCRQSRVEGATRRKVLSQPVGPEGSYDYDDPCSVSVRSDCPACVMEWVIVSTIDSGHLVVLSRICAAPSARLGHLAFEGQGAFASQC